MRIFNTAISVCLLSLVPGISAAATLPGVGTFEGSAGIGTSNGDVTDSPEGDTYVYVTTAGSDYFGAGLGVGSETNGTELETIIFTATEGSILDYYFNYVASDGTSSYVEYAYAQLKDISTGGLTTIFTARTTPSGDTVPGFGIPIDAAVTLNPTSTPIMAGSGSSGGPVWDELGGSSNTCFGSGCGFTDWINAEYTIDTAGDYSLIFGVVNWGDTAFDNGLAIAGLSLDGVDIIIPDDDDMPVIPIPASMPLLLAGLGAFGLLRRRKSRN